MSIYELNVFLFELYLLWRISNSSVGLFQSPFGFPFLWCPWPCRQSRNNSSVPRLQWRSTASPSLSDRLNWICQSYGYIGDWIRCAFMLPRLTWSGDLTFSRRNSSLQQVCIDQSQLGHSPLPSPHVLSRPTSRHCYRTWDWQVETWVSMTMGVLWRPFNEISRALCNVIHFPLSRLPVWT